MSKLREFARIYPKTSFLIFALLLGLLTVGASVLIDTDREKIERLITGSRDALEEQDAKAALEALAEDYEQDGIDRPRLEESAQTALARYGPPKIWIRKMEFEVQESTATCRVNLFSEFPYYHGIEGSSVTSSWELGLRRRGEQWRITRITPLSVGSYRPESLKALLRQSRSWE